MCGCTSPRSRPTATDGVLDVGKRSRGLKAGRVDGTSRLMMRTRSGVQAEAA